MAVETREEITALVKERSDIVQIIGECVDLKRSGVRLLGRCPFHGEKTPSFSVHAGQQFYHCFGCGESGDVFSFMMKYYNLDFQGALKELARRCQVELPEKTVSPEEQKRKQLRRLIYQVNEKAAALFRGCLLNSPEAASARAYLKNRDIAAGDPGQVRHRLCAFNGYGRLGFPWQAVDRRAAGCGNRGGTSCRKRCGGEYDRFRNRIMFPIYDSDGGIAGFGGRIIGEGQPKYMNSPESLVFNKRRLRWDRPAEGGHPAEGRVALVEGNFG